MAYGTFGTPLVRALPPAAAEARRIGRMVNVAGAALSVALLAGVGLWSYRLMVRDVAGIPVVRAMEGPMRVSPIDPGGRQAAYQGLAVNAVAAQGGVEPTPQHLILAPAATDIAVEDRVAAARPAAEPVAAVPVDPPLAEAAAVAAPEPVETVPLGTPGIARSPLPPRRPARLGQGVALAAATDPGARDALAEAALQDLATRLAAPRVVDIEPTSLAIGTRLVQFGAYETETEARQIWDDLATRFPAYLDGRGRVIEAAIAGGRVFYRLRAHGFASESETSRFCSIFLAEDLECTPVMIR